MSRIGFLCSILILTGNLSFANDELVIVSGPEIFEVPAIPLARSLELETNLPSRVHVSVTDGVDSWQRWRTQRAWTVVVKQAGGGAWITNLTTRSLVHLQRDDLHQRRITVAGPPLGVQFHFPPSLGQQEHSRSRPAIAVKASSLYGSPE